MTRTTSLIYSSGHRVQTLNFVDAQRYLLGALFLTCVFDPSGAILGAKYVFFALWMLAGVVLYAAGRQRPPSPFLASYLLLFSFLLPGYGFLVGGLRGGLDGPLSDTSYFTAGVFFLYASFLTDEKAIRYGVAALIGTLRFLSWCIVLFVALDYVGLSSRLVELTESVGLAVIATRNYGGIDFHYIYFVTSPMLAFLLAWDIWRISENWSGKRLAFACLTMAALFLSGTRANMTMCIAGPAAVILWKRIGGKAASSVLVLSLGLLAVIIGQQSTGVLGDMLSADEGNNATKLAYLSYYAEILSDPVTLAFGQGMNAHTWSEPLAEMLPEGSSVTELTYLDLIRVFGLVGAIPAMAALAYLALSERTAQSLFPFAGPGLFLYLLLAIANPYIFSSNGMILIGLVTAIVAFQRRCADHL